MSADREHGNRIEVEISLADGHAFEGGMDAMYKPVLALPILFGLGMTAMQDSTTTANSEPPAATVQQFCKMDADGMALSAEGRKQMAFFFAKPSDPQAYPKRIFVVQDFAVLRPKIEGNQAEVQVEYIYLGQLDPLNLRYSRLPSSLPPGPVKVRATYELVLTDKLAGPSPRGMSANEAVSPKVWRLVGSSEGRTFESAHVALDRVISYVRNASEKTTNSATKRNAEASVSHLEKLRK